MMKNNFKLLRLWALIVLLNIMNQVFAQGIKAFQPYNTQGDNEQGPIKETPYHVKVETLA